MIVINNWFYSHFFLDLNSCQVGLSIQYSDKFVNVMKTVRFNCRSKWYIVKINRLYSKGDKNISYRFTMKIFPSTILASVLKKIFLDTCFRISFKRKVFLTKHLKIWKILGNTIFEITSEKCCVVYLLHKKILFFSKWKGFAIILFTKHINKIGNQTAASRKCIILNPGMTCISRW